MAKEILCASCKQRKPHHAKGLCFTCYQSRFRVVYFRVYRSSPIYREQRQAYDIRYQLKQAEKEQETQKKREEILTF